MQKVGGGQKSREAFRIEQTRGTKINQCKTKRMEKIRQGIGRDDNSLYVTSLLTDYFLGYCPKQAAARLPSVMSKNHT